MYAVFLLPPISLPAPKIVFNRLNGKKYHHPALALLADNQQQESFTPAHERNVRFVHEGEEMNGWSDWMGRHFSLFHLSLASCFVNYIVLLPRVYLGTTNQPPPPPPPPFPGLTHTAVLTLIAMIGT